MKKRNFLSKRRLSGANATRRRQLFKQTQRKLSQRRHIFQNQIEMSSWAEAS